MSEVLRPDSSWASYAKLAADPLALEAALRVRLVEIAFGGGSSANIRAVDYLLGMSFPAPVDEYGDDEYGHLESSARRFLEARGFVVSVPAEPGEDES